MLIRTTRREPQVLLIEAYTFSNREWMALEDTLGRAEVRREFSPLDRDAAGRPGRRYYAEGLQQIGMLEALLGGRFDANGRFQPEPSTAKQYACREVTRNGIGKGCQEFAAADDSSAVVKCGIIAGQHNWLGGDPTPGTCRSSGSLPWLFKR